MIRFLPFLLLVFAFASCDKDEPTPTPGTGGSTNPVFTQQFKLTLNGANVFVPTLNYNTSISFNDITIYAWKDNHFFNVYLKDTLKAGTTYEFEADGMGPVSVIYRDTNNMSYIYKSQSGSMTITYVDTINKRIQGTYSCVLKENWIDSTHTITNGSFGVYYP